MKFGCRNPAVHRSLKTISADGLHVGRSAHTCLYTKEGGEESDRYSAERKLICVHQQQHFVKSFSSKKTDESLLLGDPAEGSVAKCSSCFHDADVVGRISSLPVSPPNINRLLNVGDEVNNVHVFRNRNRPGTAATTYKTRQWHH